MTPLADDVKVLNFLFLFLIDYAAEYNVSNAGATFEVSSGKGF